MINSVEYLYIYKKEPFGIISKQTTLSLALVCIFFFLTVVLFPVFEAGGNERKEGVY